MPPPQVLVIGPPEDDHASRIAAALGRRGASVLLLDLEPFPAVLSLAIDAEGAPTWRGEDLRGARSAYVRQVAMRLPFFEMADAPPEARVETWRTAYAAERERQSFFAAYLLALERAGVRVVNPIATLDQHFVKVDQLAILRAAGLPVPRTLATNDAGAVRAFAASLGDRVVFKPLAGGDLCRRLAPGDVEALERGVRAWIFQEEAAGRNVRVYVVGGRAVASYEIESDAIDFRGHEKAVRAIDPMPAVDEACVRAAAACGMSFTGIDLRVATPRELTILECNPSPMFAGFERAARAGTPVTDALCAHLLG